MRLEPDQPDHFEQNPTAKCDSAYRGGRFAHGASRGGNLTTSLQQNQLQYLPVLKRESFLQ